MPKNRKSQAFSTRLKKETLLDYEEYKEQKKDKTGQEPGNSEALRDLAKIGLESTVGEGTPAERELRRDVEELEREVERIEDEKADLQMYVLSGAIMALGLFLSMAAAIAQTQFDNVGFFNDIIAVGVAVAILGTFCFMLAPVLNRIYNSSPTLQRLVGSSE